MEMCGKAVSTNLTGGVGSAGGGIATQSGNVTLNSSTASGNSTTGGSSSGGGIYASGGNVTLTESTVSGNSTAGATGTGGGIFVDLGTFTMTNSTLAGNSTLAADAYGGGLYSGSGQATIISSTVSDNSVLGVGAKGGGVYSDTGSISLINAIVAANTAMTFSSGPDLYFNNGNSTGTFAANHSLVGINTGAPLAAAPVGSPDANGNLVGTSVAPIDPKLAALADNGGPTQTMALLADSPAIDAGGTTALTTDQRGAPFARVVGGQLDMGAYEAQLLSLVVTTASDELDPVYDPDDLSLREAISLANANAGHDTITFAPAISGQSINLTLGQLTITDTATITGLGSANTVINGQQLSRIFEITSTAGDVSLDALSITNGKTTAAGASGAGILFQATGTLSLSNSVVSGNSTTGSDSDGAGIYCTAGIVNLTDTSVTSNAASGFGGGIWANGSVTLTASSITSNSADGGGGGILVGAGNVTLNTGSSVSSNSTPNGTGGGISVATGSVFVTGGSHVDGNSAFEVGGIMVGNVANPVDDAVRVIGGSTVSNNSSTGGNPPDSGNYGGGGIAALTFGNVFIDGGSQVNNNQTVGMYSGGIVLGLGSITVTGESQVNGNTNNGPGGGIAANFGGTITVTGGSQVNGNTGAAIGGAITNFAGPLGGVVISGGSQVNDNTLTNGETLGQAIDVFLAIFDPDGSATAFANAVGGAGGAAMLAALASEQATATSLLVQLNAALANMADPATTIVGGAIGTLIAPITISAGSQVNGNYAGKNVTDGTAPFTVLGGAIFIIDNTILLDHSTVAGNQTAGASTGAGGGLYSILGEVTLSSVTVSGNSTQTGGGGILTAGGAVSITNSTIADNSATSPWATGGGIQIKGGSLSLTSATVSGNSASGAGALGGGIFAGNADVTLDNSIVAVNTSNGGIGADILFHTTTGNTLTADNSLIGDNSGTTLAPAPVGSPDANGNLVGTAANPIDPELSPLAANGGLTQTMALSATSPAINAGGTTAKVYDQRDAPFARVVGGQLDMGAFENQLVNTTPVTTITVTEGARFCDETLMTFTSGNYNAVATDFTATVDWGTTVLDPSVTVRFVSASGGESHWEVVGMGTYPTGSAAGSPYAITVTVQDAHGDSAISTNTTIDVAQPTPPIRQLARQTGLAGFYYENGALAEVLQNGNVLTLIDGDGNTSAGTIANNSAITAPGFGLTGTFDQADGTITFSDTTVWTKVRQIAGQWTTSNDRVAGIAQLGTDLTFTGGSGSTSAGHFVSATEVIATDWGNLAGTLSGDGLAIHWANGSVWSLIPDFQGNWSTSNGGPTRIEQQGATLEFINRAGDTSIGKALNATQVVTGANWGSVVGNIVGNSIQFANGITWSIPAVTTEDPDLGGLWQNAALQNTRVLQADTVLTFVNRSGQTSAGEFVSPTEVHAIDWNQNGQLAGNRILWDNGTIWTEMPTIAGAYFNQVNSETGINQLGQQLTLTDAAGVVTHGTLTDPTHITETDGDHRTATISGNVITWSNGPVWTMLPELSGNWAVASTCDSPTYVEQSGSKLLFIDSSGSRLRGAFDTPTHAELTREEIPSPPAVSVSIPNDQLIDFGSGLEWNKYPPNLLDDVFADPNFWPFV
jgi:hypothetical protein